MKARLLLLVLLAAGACASAAQVYSWTDANGTKHFSDSPPPPSVNAQKIKVRGALTTEDGTQPATAPARRCEPKPPEPAPPGTGATASAKPLVDSPENRAKQCQMAKSNSRCCRATPGVGAGGRRRQDGRARRGSRAGAVEKAGSGRVLLQEGAGALACAASRRPALGSRRVGVFAVIALASMPAWLALAGVTEARSVFAIRRQAGIQPSAISADGFRLRENDVPREH